MEGTTRPFQTLLLKYHPTDSNQFFIGTNLVSKMSLNIDQWSSSIDCETSWIVFPSFQGLVSHGTSHGLKTPPQFYGFQEVEERTVDINSIHFSPFRPNLFLVGRFPFLNSVHLGNTALYTHTLVLLIDFKTKRKKNVSLVTLAWSQKIKMIEWLLLWLEIKPRFISTLQLAFKIKQLKPF